MSKSAPPRGKAAAASDAASDWAGHLRARFGLIDRVLAGVDWLNKGLLWMLCGLLAGMAVLGFAQVIARYFLGSPLTWSEEVLRFALIWLPFLGVGIVVRKGHLIAVEFLVNVLPGGPAEALRIVVLVLSGLLWLLLAVYGFTVLEVVRGMRAGATEVPMWIVYSVIPFGASLALINTVAALVDRPEIVLAEAD